MSEPPVPVVITSATGRALIVGGSCFPQLSVLVQSNQQLGDIPGDVGLDLPSSQNTTDLSGIPLPPQEPPIAVAVTPYAAPIANDDSYAEESPIVNDQSFSISENAKVGSVVGSVLATDVDLGQAIQGFSIASGNIGGAFSIDASGQITVASESALDFETNSVFLLTVEAYDSQVPQGTGTALITINLVDLAEVSGVIVDNGTSQRSQISSLTIQFDTEVEHAGLASAFSITNIDTGVSVGTVHVLATNNLGKTSAELTFSGASTDARIGTGRLGNSLANGNYRLDISKGQVISTSNNQTMASDYLFGNQTKSDINNDLFFRLLGDANGDGVRNGIDLNAIIPTLFDPLGYRADLDTNGDGAIDDIDLDGLIPTLFGARRN